MAKVTVGDSWIVLVACLEVGIIRVLLNRETTSAILNTIASKAVTQDLHLQLPINLQDLRPLLITHLLNMVHLNMEHLHPHTHPTSNKTSPTVVHLPIHNNLLMEQTPNNHTHLPMAASNTKIPTVVDIPLNLNTPALQVTDSQARRNMEHLQTQEISPNLNTAISKAFTMLSIPVVCMAIQGDRLPSQWEATLDSNKALRKELMVRRLKEVMVVGSNKDDGNVDMRS